MSEQKNNQLILKTCIIGILIATLVYSFHPSVGQFSLSINGEPVADPLIRLAAIPTLLFTMVLTGILMILAFLGISAFMFIAAFIFVFLGILLLAPYFWPMLVIIYLLILLMSIGEAKK